jgi:hypothetical protein
VTELTLLDTKDFRVDVVAEPEKLFLASLENVLRLADALGGAIHLAIEMRTVVELARRATPPLPGAEQPSADIDPLLLLRRLERIAGEIQALGKDAKIAS